jgi:hypothetical protein
MCEWRFFCFWMTQGGCGWKPNFSICFNALSRVIEHGLQQSKRLGAICETVPLTRVLCERAR